MRTFILLKSQLPLFEVQTDVEGYTRKDGRYVAPHRARRKRAVKPPVAVTPSAVKDQARINIGDVVEFEWSGKKRAPARGEVVALDGDIVKVRVTQAPIKNGAGRVIPLRPDSCRRIVAAAHSADEKGSNPAAPASAQVSPQGALDFESPPIAQRDYDFGARYDATPAQRRADNAAALQILANKPTNDLLTDDDKAVLARYSGRGGIGDSLNEYYTRPDVASAIWSVIERNFEVPGRAVLEPSCATGVFMHTAPPMFSCTGVELDPTSSRIAKVLHQQHEVQCASLEGFASTDGRLFDVVIGNPPFGPRGALIGQDKKDIARAEQYFVDTALDKCKEGGIVALIVPTGIVDASSAAAMRKRWICKGQFLGAVRMPNTAFKHSQTEVTTDVVFFRRRAPDVAQALLILDDDHLRGLGVADDEFVNGDYFTGRGAANVLGSMEEGWRAKAGMGQDITVSGSMQGVADAIASFAPEAASPRLTMAGILDRFKDDELGHARLIRAALKAPYEVARVGDSKVVDGVAYVLQGEPPRWHRVDGQIDAVGLPEHISEVRGLGDQIAQFAMGVPGVGSGEIIQGLRDYIAKHGIPRRDPEFRRLAQHDEALHRIMAAVRDDGSFSDLLTGRQAESAVSLDAAAERLSLEHGSFTLKDLRSAYPDMEQDEAEDHLFASDKFALDPVTGHWAAMGQYLSGELWPKLDAARDALKTDRDAATRAKYELQAQLLDQAINPKSLEDVEVTLASGWVPVQTIETFLNHRRAEYLKITPSSASWYTPFKVSFENAIYVIEGGGSVGTETNLLPKYLNRTGLRQDDVPLIDRLNEDFKQWLLTSDQRDPIEDIYNRSYTGFIAPSFSDEPMDVPGLNPNMLERLKRYQWPGVRWALQVGKGIIAADVGLGKTVRGLILAKLLKMHGRARKPMIVVPKSVLANWLAEIELWFPGSKVMVIGETYTTGKDGGMRGKPDTAAVRNQKYHDLAQNEYDFVLMSQPAWNDLDLGLDLKNGYVGDDFWVQRGEQLGNAGDKRKRQIRESYEQSIAQRDFEKRSDVIHFEDLGVDALIMDEGHAYKNLFAARARFGEQPKFLGGTGLSNRALDTQMKARYVREHADGKNVFMLTATPTKNSPLEIYSMLSHIAPEAFERMGIRNSEEFIDRFCEFKEGLALGVNGQIESALITSGFKNLDELREVMKRYIDRKTAEDVGLKLPARDQREHLVTMSARQQAAYNALREEADSGINDAGDDAHIFSTMDKMGKAAMDLELLNPKLYAGEVSPKYVEAVKTIKEFSKEGGQVVFCEHVDSHEKLRDMLVKAGFKPEQIGIINAKAAPSSLARQKISDAYNAGKIKVVIGNTPTMGEGINLQTTTTDIHHLDIPWEPASMQQRNGRGVRQGNIHEAVRLHRYIAKGSFDGYRYQTMSSKGDWQSQLWTGGNRLENLSASMALSREEMLIMLSADPESARKAFDEDHAAAKQRFEAGKRADAGAEFVRFTELSRSYKDIKNKDSVSASRLRSKMDMARGRLESNPYFDAKDALTDPDSVVVDKDTGRAFRPNTVLEFEVKNHEPINWADGKHRFVVTGINPETGALALRAWGQAGSGIQVKASAIAHRATEHALDTEAEGRALSAGKIGDLPEQIKGLLKSKMEPAKIESAGVAVKEAIDRAVAENVDWHASAASRGQVWAKVANAARESAPSVDTDRLQQIVDAAELSLSLAAHGVNIDKLISPMNLRSVPESAILSNRSVLDRYFASKVLNYQDSDRDKYLLVDRATKEPKVAPSYEGRRLMGEYRQMLPIEEDRARAMKAWVDARLNRRYDIHFSTSTRRNSNTHVMPGVTLKYGGILDNNNPWDSAVKLFGAEFTQQGREEVDRQSRALAQGETLLNGRIKAWLPTAESLGYSGKGRLKWTNESLRDIARFARASGEIHSPVEKIVHGVSTGVFDYAYAGHTGGTSSYGAPLGYCLRKLAEENGDEELAKELADIPFRPQAMAA